MGFGQMPSPQPQMMDQAQAMPMMNRPLIPQSGSQLHNASNEVNIPMGQIAHVRRTETLLGDSGLRSMPPSLQQSQIMAQRRQDSQVGYPWQPQNLQHRGAKENVLQFQDNWQKMEQMATANQRGLLRQLQSMQPQRLREQQQRQQQYMGQEPIMQSGRRPSQPEIPLTYQTGQNVPMDLFSDSHMSNPPEIQSSPEGDNQDTSQGKGLAEPSRNPFAYTVSSSTAEPSYMSIKDPVAFLFGSEPNTDYQYDAGVGHNTKTTTGMKSILNNTLGWERDDIPKQSRSLSPNPGPESISRTRIKRPANAVDGSSEEEDSPGNRKRLKTSEDDPHPIFTRTQVNFDAIHKSVIPGTEKLEEKDIVDVLLDQWTVDVNGICA